MASIIEMPKLGFNMDAGKIVSWYKQEGDVVKKGEPLFSMETDKTAIDVEATGEGVVKKLLVEEGTEVDVFLPIAIIGEAEEDISALLAECTAKLGGEPAAPTAPAAPAAESTTPAPVPAPAPAPAAPTPAQEGGYDYDVIVMGGGPGGYVAAIKAAQMGKKVALAEKDKLGGTCLNRGCIPTKALLRSAEVLGELSRAAEFGITGVDVSGAKLDMSAVIRRKQTVVSGLVSGVGGLLKGNGVTVVNGVAQLLDPHTVSVGGQTMSAANVIIATGSETKFLPVPTSPKMNVITSTEALDMAELPESMVIIGGGVIGMEFADFYSNLDMKVTVVEFLPDILPMVDEEISAMAAKSLARKGIDIITGAKVVEITGTEVVYEKDGQTVALSCQAVLMAVGRAPCLEGVDCDRLGIRTERGAIVTDGQMRTNVPGVYAIGDVNGKSMLAHVASMEGIVAVETICGKAASMRYDHVPSCIYIEPEIACVGLTESQARKQYGSVKVGKFPIMANGKAKVFGNTEGVIKVIVEPRYNEIVGAHLYCVHASDMIAEMVVAMEGECVADQLLEAIHPHPSVSESVHEALHAAVDKAIHFM